MSHAKLSIGIAGAGLLGRLIAWRLLRKGHRVMLFDRGPEHGTQAAAWTAAGMVAPLSEAVASDRFVYDMGRYALRQWPQWVKQLPAHRRPLWQFNGSLVVAHPQDQSELTQFYRDLYHVTGDTQGYQWLTRPALHSLEPDLNDQFQHGLLLENEGHLDNRTLFTALGNALRELGGHCVFDCEVELESGLIHTPSGPRRFDQVIDCRGMGAKSGFAELRGVRGEILQVQTRDLTLNRPVRLMHPRYQLYVVPKPEHHFVIGATQIESEDRSPMSLQSSLELSSALYTLAPAFSEARIVEQSVNLRPALPDNNPRITREDRLLRVNGLFRHGYLLAPAVVDQVVAMIDGGADTEFAPHLLNLSRNTLNDSRQSEQRAG